MDVFTVTVDVPAAGWVVMAGDVNLPGIGAVDGEPHGVKVGALD